MRMSTVRPRPQVPSLGPVLGAMLLIIGLGASRSAAAAEGSVEESVEASDDAPPRTVVLPLRFVVEDQSQRDALERSVATSLVDQGYDAVRFGELPEVMRKAYEGDAEACESSGCLTLIADATAAEFVVYGSVTPSEGGVLVELKLFSAEAGRPLSRSTAEAPILAAILPAMPQVVAQLKPTEVEPEPVLEEEKEEPVSWLYTSPLFISGVAVALIGAVVSIAGTAYALDANATLSTPEKAAALKKDALDYGMYGIYVGLAGIPVALAGGALATYTALFLAPVDDELESAEKAP